MKEPPRRPRKDEPKDAGTASVTPPSGQPPLLPPAGSENQTAWMAEDASNQTGWVERSGENAWVDKNRSTEGWVAPDSEPRATSSDEAVDPDDTVSEANPPGGGRRLGDFLLERKVGQGGMGEVWLARQVSLDRPVAVKVLPRSLANQDNFIERFQREAKAAASLVHPNVLQIYSFGVNEGTPYFAMEFIEGEDLQQRMRRGQGLEWLEVAQIMIGVASALAVAHDKGLIHRDIKPSNVMIDRNGVVKVMDFGLAKATTGGNKNLTSAGLIMGTPNYLSPEQGRGDPLDGRSDLYSLGIVLYELCTGQLPFRADTPAGLIFKHVYEPPPPPLDLNPQVPKFLVEIVLKLLEKDPDDRYKTARELLADLAEFIENSDHYIEAGGERRPGAGYLDANKVAKSGGFSVTGGARKRAEARNAVTEPVTRPSDDELEVAPATSNARTKGVARPRPVEDEVVEAEIVEEAEAQDAVEPSARRSSRRVAPVAVPPPRRGGGSGKVLLLLLLAAAGGGAWVYTQRPDLLARLGLPVAASVGPPSTSTTTKGPAEQAAFTLEPAALPSGVSAALVGSRARHELKPNVEGVYDVGEYQLEMHRPGYQPCSFFVKVVRGEDGRGSIVDAQGRDALRAPREWTASKELADHYAKGKSLLAQDDLAEARAELERAARLDEGYSPTPDEPTVRTLLDDVAARLSASETSLARLDERFGMARVDADQKRWRSALKILEDLPEAQRTEAWRGLLERCTSELALSETLRAAVETAIARGAHGEAGERFAALRAADAEHPQLAALEQRLDDARRSRAAAMDEAGDGTTAAVGRLRAYLESFGREDDAARRQLEALESRLSGEEQLVAAVGDLERAVQAQDWAAARRMAAAILRDHPDHPVASRVRSEAEAQLARQAIEARLAEMDAALVGGKPDEVLRHLVADGPTYAIERAALEGMARVRASFVKSEHRDAEVEVEGEHARVLATWEFTVQALGEAPRTLIARHRITLRRQQAGGWLVSELRVEGDIRGKQ